ncbi:ATP-binding protein [Ramlibacter tataouinensis]|uniref:histidine kinase n=1 Tax=Ramlibacter tataouinensis (strain ATCC BAA-407 / DSM 14655 / LMG 21543 / TTB310) TaxID=365046 RepID=F5Y047_RAMTT|nr:ATP-binding protein [Ramlibacter tataouinensis]AEG94596.1 candidate histidine kinase, classic [Ramlibacter tataouinensis TTB310]
MMRIFRSGAMCSIRHTLLLWLVPLFLIVGAASALFSYWSYSRMVSTFMDDQMQQLGDSIVQTEEHVAPPVPSRERLDEWGAYVVQVWDAQGRLESSSWPSLAAGLAASPGFADLRVDGTGWRAYASAPGRAGQRVQVLQSGEFRRKLAAEKAGAAVAPVMILLPLAILILWGVAGAISREVQAIGRAAAEQNENNIAELPLARVPCEIAPLVHSFNGLLTRLRDAFTAQRRFVQDAAHELRTPITAVALQLENVRCDLPPGVCAQSFAQLEAGVARAQRLVDQMLKLSRQQDVSAQEAPAAVDLQAQLHESINALIALADQRGIDLGLVAPEQSLPPMVLRCGQGDLRSVLDNLIENALRYAPVGGVVDVRLSCEAGRAVVEVVDTGPGIPPDQLHRVFDRFFRVPGNGARGSGLGLAIAQAAAQRCGLRITLRNREDRSGLIARVEQA